MTDYVELLETLAWAMREHPSIRVTVSHETLETVAVELKRLYALTDEQQATIALLEQVARY